MCGRCHTYSVLVIEHKEEGGELGMGDFKGAVVWLTFEPQRMHVCLPGVLWGDYIHNMR